MFQKLRQLIAQGAFEGPTAEHTRLIQKYLRFFKNVRFEYKPAHRSGYFRRPYDSGEMTDSISAMHWHSEKASHNERALRKKVSQLIAQGTFGGRMTAERRLIQNGSSTRKYFLKIFQFF